MNHNLTQRYKRAAALMLCVISLTPISAEATGITADAGLTPPVDRWIFRSQLRYMENGEDPTDMGREMNMYASPLVLAYGLRPNVTVVARQILYHREMNTPAGSMEKTGTGDLFLLSKWRLLRVNTKDFIIGIAPTLGLEIPTGDNDFGSDTWDIAAGCYFTARRGPWGADVNIEYKLNGVDDRNGDRPGDAFSTTLALAYQFTLDDDATMSLWPVLELTYEDSGRNHESGASAANSGGDILQIAPGLKFAHQSMMLEALIQLPVQQDRNENQLERQWGGLIGIRYLF